MQRTDNISHTKQSDFISPEFSLYYPSGRNAKLPGPDLNLSNFREKRQDTMMGTLKLNG